MSALFSPWISDAFLGGSRYEGWITLTLYCNGEVMNVATPKPKDGWYEYYDLPETYNGAPAVYTVVEEPLPGFTAAYKDANGQGVGNGVNGGTIVNSKIPDTGDRTPVGLAAGLVAASVIGLVLLLVWRRKKKRFLKMPAEKQDRFLKMQEQKLT